MEFYLFWDDARTVFSGRRRKIPAELHKLLALYVTTTYQESRSQSDSGIALTRVGLIRGRRGQRNRCNLSRCVTIIKRPDESQPDLTESSRFCSRRAVP